MWDISPYAKARASPGGSGQQREQLRALAATAAHDKDVNALAVSPNDALIASASQDRTAKARLLRDRAVIACPPCPLRLAFYAALLDHGSIHGSCICEPACILCLMSLCPCFR